ncbi:MFS transporter [Blastococcus haudaquaticus]|uniref:Predicted arabinose efflux permease, MFS family n=1 Tax=Blastococcus haudaquaticus TaxID=1938745 RepID=A0A286GH61_9ACTN|nr:MFS transporter [Blastococcus haudaquaticus]SOD94812.1 Predicted arabinose efflux permease, MFS family [Blastococcus haudaquaticus]
MTCETAPAPAAAPPADPPTPRSPHAVLGALTVSAGATVTVELAPTGLLPEIAADLGVSASAAGSLVAVWALTLAATSLLLVRATRRLPRQRVIAVGVLVSGLATLASAAAPTLAAAVLARLVGAAAHGLVWALLVPHAASLVPPERLGRAVAVVLAGPTAAAVLGVPLATALGGAVGWRTAFALLALLTIPPACVLLVAPAAARRESTGTGTTWWRDPSMPGVLRSAAATAAVLAGHFAAATYVAVLVTDAGHLPAAAVPVVLFVFGAAGVAGLTVAGPLSDRRPNGALAGTAVAFAVALAALGLLGTHPVPAFLVVALWGFLVGLLPPVFQTRMARLAAPQVRDVAGALAITALNVGIAAGAVLGGLVLTRWGPPGLVVAATALAATGAAALVPWRRTPGRAHGAPTPGEPSVA